MDYSLKIRNKIINADTSIIQTMKMMDNEKTKSFLVFDKDRFIGIITNGDLQRAIIDKISFDTSIRLVINNSIKKYAHVGDAELKIKDWLLQMRAEFMPVLDDLGNLVDVVFWDELFPKEEIDDKKQKLKLPVVIMAGGKGARLKPLTNVIPKPLIPIGDKTILEEIMDQFERIGCNQFFLSVNFKVNTLKFYLENLEHKYNVDYFQEEKPLGTIGSVSLLKGKVNTPFFVSNCDIVIDQDYRDVYDYHIKNHNDITIITAVKSFKIPYGVIETGKDGLMTKLKEKPEITYMINTGVYILNPECIDEIPQEEFFHITNLMEKIKLRDGRVGCFPVSEHSWRDMGEWSEYLKMIKVL